VDSSCLVRVNIKGKTIIDELLQDIQAIPGMEHRRDFSKKPVRRISNVEDRLEISPPTGFCVQICPLSSFQADLWLPGY
jgi:hypothetical protein